MALKKQTEVNNRPYMIYVRTDQLATLQNCQYSLLYGQLNYTSLRLVPLL